MRSVTLDDLDRKIIHALYFDPRAAFSRLAEVLGVSEQTVARRYRALRDSGTVRVVGQLDSQRLGHSDWAVRVHCAPDAARRLAAALAARTDTSWIQLTSGGTEIFGLVHGQGEADRTALLLEQLPAIRQVHAIEAHALLHVFANDQGALPGTGALGRDQVSELRASASVGAVREGAGGTPSLRDDDWPLIRALSADGRSTYRELAARTHWHESTVRRRMEELTRSGTLYFDLDVSPDALGLRSRAVLWLSVAPAELMVAGATLSARREVPFVAATTGASNLLATLSCENDASLFDFMTREIAGLAGVTRIETSPVLRSIKMHATMTAVMAGAPAGRRRPARVGAGAL